MNKFSEFAQYAPRVEFGYILFLSCLSVSLFVTLLLFGKELYLCNNFWTIEPWEMETTFLTFFLNQWNSFKWRLGHGPCNFTMTFILKIAFLDIYAISVSQTHLVSFIFMFVCLSFFRTIHYYKWFCFSLEACPCLPHLESQNNYRYIYCIQLWICPVLFSPYRDLFLIHQVLNSPTLQFSYIILLCIIQLGQF